MVVSVGRLKSLALAIMLAATLQGCSSIHSKGTRSLVVSDYTITYNGQSQEVLNALNVINSVDRSSTDIRELYNLIIMYGR
jgi:hypothetical protein